MNLKPLTPAQRALEHLIVSMVISAIGMALLLIVPFISGPGYINWLLVGGLFAFAFFAVLGGRMSTYLKPEQPALADTINALIAVVENILEQRYGVQVSQLIAALKNFNQQQQQQQAQPLPPVKPSEEPSK